MIASWGLNGAEIPLLAIAWVAFAIWVASEWFKDDGVRPA